MVTCSSQQSVPQSVSPTFSAQNVSAAEGSEVNSYDTQLSTQKSFRVKNQSCLKINIPKVTASKLIICDVEYFISFPMGPTQLMPILQCNACVMYQLVFQHFSIQSVVQISCFNSERCTQKVNTTFCKRKSWK